MKKILFALFLISVLPACQVENIHYTKPVVETYEPQNVLTTSASLGGYVLSEGGLKNTEYGIVYSSVSEMPTVSDTKIVFGEGIGEFYYNIEEFEPGTNYHYRAYAINSEGVGYGDVYAFTTTEPAPCNPVQSNFIDFGGTNSVVVTDTDFVDDGSFLDGNIEFIAYGAGWNGQIYIDFNEVDGRLPLTGTYEVVSGFDSQEPKSVGKVMLLATNWQTSGAGIEGTKIYVENNNGEVTFIFCDLETTSNFYTLNGKFTYPH